MSLKKIAKSISSGIAKSVGRATEEEKNRVPTFYVDSPKFGGLDFEGIKPTDYQLTWENDKGGYDTVTLATSFIVNGQPYLFIPEDFVIKGLVKDGYQYYSRSFLNKDNLNKLYKEAELVDLGRDIPTAMPEFGSKGFLMKPDTFISVFPTGSRYKVGRDVGQGASIGEITGIGEINGKLVYAAKPMGKAQTAWIQPESVTGYDGQGGAGTIQARYVEVKKKGGLLGDIGRAISSVPLLPEIAGVVTANPYVYAGLKGLSLGAQGVDPIKAGLMVGANIAVTTAIKSPDFTKSVGKAVLGSTISDATASIVGASIVGGTSQAVIAATVGGDVGKSFLTGAVASGVLTGSGEVAEAIIGKENITSIAELTGLSKTAVENVIARSLVDGAIASANGQDFLEAAGTSMVAGGLSAKAASEVTGALRDKVGADTLKGIGTATAEIVRTGSTAAIQGEDVGKALENAAPGIVLSSLTAALDKPKEQQKVAEAPAPVQVAGGGTGIGLLLDQKFSPSDVEVSSRVVDGVRETVYEGFDNNGQNYRYSIIGTPQGNTYYSFIDSAGQKQFSVADPTTRTELESNLFSGAVGKLDPISGALIIEVRGVGGAGEPVAPLPITAGLDLRQYVGAEGAGRAIIGGGGRPGGRSTGINLLGRDSATGLDKFDINGEGFTLLVLPGNRQALISDVRDVVYFPTLTEDTGELRLDEAPLDTLIPKTETPPAQLPTGPAAGGAEGVTGPEGALGGLPSFAELRQQERDRFVAKIIEDELAQLERELSQASANRQIAEQNLQRSREQTARLTRLPERTRIPTAIQEILDAEIGNLERASREAEDLERSLTTRREQIGAVQQGEAELSDEDILGYLETGRLPSGGTVTGPGAGTGARGEGEGALAPGEGEGAGEEGEGVGGGEEGGAGDGGLQPRLGGRVVFNRLDLPESRPFASRVTGEALASILGAKEPLFGGDEDEQQAVWNRRSLRLRKALGL